MATEPDAAGKLFMALNIERAEKDLSGAAKYLAGHSSTAKLGAVGFCMGGQLALFAGCTNPNVGAVVDFYGIHPNVKPEYTKLNGPVLGLFAEKDGFVTPQTAREVEAAIKKAGKPVEINIYPGVDHGFFNDDRGGARHQFAFLVRYNRHVEETESTFHLSYQYYIDTWGVSSHMAELDWYQNFGDAIQITRDGVAHRCVVRIALGRVVQRNGRDPLLGIRVEENAIVGTGHLTDS